MEALHVTIPIPPRSLSVNSRVHWAVRMKATKRCRVDAWAAVQVAMHEQGVKGKWTHCECRVVWYARCNRRRDKDNLLASLKATFDGLVDGGLLIDDAGITHLPLSIDVDPRNPRVELHLKETDGKEEAAG